MILSLVKSDNFAAQILCQNLEDCIPKMNEMAQSLGMVNTTFDEPTGLSRNNVSTAQDLLKLLIASSANTILSELSSMPAAEVSAGSRLVKVSNTNPLTHRLNIFLSKTGFTTPAGGCLVMAMHSDSGQRFIVLLGSRNSRTRIPDMEKLVKQSD